MGRSVCRDGQASKGKFGIRMKRAEFKNLIKESIKEVLIEEGILSTIVSEVFKGAQVPQQVVTEQATPSRIAEPANPDNESLRATRVQAERTKITETKRKMLEAIGEDSYNGVNLFEGTTPIGSAGNPGQAEAPSSPLAGVSPGDPGIDISSLMGNVGVWKKMAK